MATNGTRQVQVRRTPFTALEQLHEIFPTFFDARWPFRLPRVLEEEARTPAVDMFERNGNVVVKAELPGITADKIEVTVTGNELRIGGEREEEKEVREENYYHAERTYGRVFRTLTLPEGCDAEGVKANAKDGIVEVVVPRKAVQATKKVEVKHA